MELTPVMLSTRYQHLNQYALGGEAQAQKELPLKLIVLGTAILIVTFILINDFGHEKHTKSNVDIIDND